MFFDAATHFKFSADLSAFLFYYTAADKLAAAKKTADCLRAGVLVFYWNSVK